MKKTMVDLITMAIYVVSFIVFLLMARVSWRAVFFGVRLTVARHRAVHSQEVMTRWFGRAGIAYCAHIIAFRDRGALKRGGFLAKRVIGAARAACNKEFRLGGAASLSDMDAEQWMSEITGEVLPRKQVRYDGHTQRRGDRGSDQSRRSDHNRTGNRRDFRPRSNEGGPEFRPLRRDEAVPEQRQPQPVAPPLFVVKRQPARPAEPIQVAPEKEVILEEPPELRDMPQMEEMPDFLEDLDAAQIAAIDDDHDQAANSKLAV